MTKYNGYSLTHIGIGYLVAAVALFTLAPLTFADTLPGLDVHIGAGGNAQVEGAQVTAVNGADVSAKTSLGSTIINWLVKTDSNTEFSAKSGQSGLTNIVVGDTISFRGTIDQTASNLTVKAKAVRDWSKTEAKTKLHGTVSAINASLNSFVITNGNSTTTVQTSSSTKFSLNGAAGSFANIFLSAKVKVMGAFNASSTIFNATSVDIASSTNSHDKWTKDDKRAWRDWIRSKVWLHVGR